MVPHRVPQPDDLLQPADIFLLEHAPDSEEVNQSSTLFHAPGRRQRVLLHGLAEISLLVIPLGLVPGGIVAGHLQIDADRDERRRR